MNKKIYLILPMILVSCVQEASRITYKDGSDYSFNDNIEPSYMRGAYTTNNNNKVVRDIRKSNNNINYEDEEFVKNISSRKTKSYNEDKNENYDDYKYENNLKNKEDTLEPGYIKVKAGDNVTKLSKEYNMTIKEFIDLNNISEPYNIYIGQKLKVDTNSKNDKNNDLSKKEENKKEITKEKDQKKEDKPKEDKTEKVLDNNDYKNYKTVTVEKGDSLIGISSRYDMTLNEIAKINNIKPPYNVYVDQKLKIPSENFKNAKVKKNNGYHIVEKGDSLYGIARENNLSLTEIIKYNNLKKPYNIYPGQKLYLKELNNSNSGNKNSNSSSSNAVKNEKEIKNTNNTKEVKKEVKNGKNIQQKQVRSLEDGRKNENEKIAETKNKQEIFIWPVKGEVIKKFGKQEDGKLYDAINIKAEQGTSILAARDGTIAYAGNELKGYGNIIIIQHEGGWLSIYGYCEKINVKVKDKVKEGDVIATVGKTGNVTEPQLYFTVRKGRVALDPLQYLKN